MDEHGGSRAGDLVVALRQELKRQLRKHGLLAHISRTFFRARFPLKLTVRVVTFYLKSY